MLEDELLDNQYRYGKKLFSSFADTKLELGEQEKAYLAITGIMFIMVNGI